MYENGTDDENIFATKTWKLKNNQYLSDSNLCKANYCLHELNLQIQVK